MYVTHYNPRHVSSINMPIFSSTNCIITASGIVTICKRLYSMPDGIRHTVQQSEDGTTFHLHSAWKRSSETCMKLTSAEFTVENS
jgi:hypothetical protein